MEFVEWVATGAVTGFGVLLSFMIRKIYLLIGMVKDVEITCRNINTYLETEKNRITEAHQRVDVHDRFASKISEGEIDTKQVVQGRHPIPILSRKVELILRKTHDRP